MSMLRASLVMALGASSVSAAQARWQLVVDHRIGDASSPNTMFTDLRGIVAGRNGNVFVFDSKTQDIRMFDAKGAFVRRVARHGRGPGELLNANGMLARPSGGFVVNDPDNGRITVWSASGEYQGQIPSLSSYSAYVWEAGWDGDRIVERTTKYVPPPQPGRRGDHVPVLRRIDPSGKADTLSDPTCRDPNAPAVTTFFGERGRGPGMMVPFLGVQRKALDSRGQAWCSPGVTYRVSRYRFGSESAVDWISASSRAETIPARERDSAVAVVDSFGIRWPNGNVDSRLVPTVRAAVEGLTVDDKGRLWVRRPALPSARARFDVWADGNLVGIVESPLRLAREIPIVIVGDRFYAVALDEDDVQTVVVATIRTGGR
jgi:hypothetical protein